MEGTTFTSGGKTYTLALKTAGLMALQKHFSTPDHVANLGDIFQTLVTANSIEHVVAVIWASLRKHHPEVTFEQTADLIDEAGGIEGLSDQLGLLIHSATPDPEDVAELRVEADPQKAQAMRGTGESSNSQLVAPV